MTMKKSLTLKKLQIREVCQSLENYKPPDLTKIIDQLVNLLENPHKSKILKTKLTSIGTNNMPRA